MKKVIVKTQVEQVETVLNLMRGIGWEFSEPVWQHERVYLPSNFQPWMNFPRMVLRTEVQETSQPAQYALYLKRHIEDSGVDYVHFTAVGDYTETTGIIHQLGFKKVTEVSRQRRSVHLDPQAVMYLDKVEGIDMSFLKIEVVLGEGMKVEGMKKELYKSLSLLGQKTFLLQTYAEMLTGNQIQPYFLPE